MTSIELLEPQRGKTTPTDFVDNGKPWLTWDEAAAQITRINLVWGSGIGQPATVSYAFRASANDLPTDASGFTQFNAAQIAATELALGFWAEVANINFVRTGSGTTGPSAYSDNAEILLGAYATHPVLSRGAEAFFPGSGRGGDVWVHLGYPYFDQLNPTYSTQGFATLLHEVGHSIGLTHPSNYNGDGFNYADHAEYFADNRVFTVLSYFHADLVGARLPYWLLGIHDIAAAQRLYGPNMTTRAGATTYGFNSNTGSVQFTLTSASQATAFAIWDAGGEDTLDLSGYATASVIDLREEAFSSAGPYSDNQTARYNISIARGAIIENAIGGAGADTLIGNSAANTLTGGLGSDTLTGGAGADTFAGTLAELDSDIIADFSAEDRIVVTGAVAAVRLGAATIQIDANGDGAYEATLRFGQSFGLGSLSLNAIDGGRTAIAFVSTSGPLVMGGPGDDTLDGTPGGDMLRGAGGADTVRGGAGDDLIVVAAGDFIAGDSIDGGPGTDTLRTAGANIDYRVGQVAGIERIQFDRTGAEPTLNAMFALSQLAGLGPNLVLVGSPAQDSVQIFLPSGGSVSTAGWAFDFPDWGLDDYIVYVGDAGAETFTGFPGLDIFFGGPGDDIYDGAGATDFAAHLFSPNAVTADLALTGPQTIGGNQGRDTFINLEGLGGSQLADTLLGDAGANFLVGVGGDDILVGRGGADDIRGGDGADRIEGNAGTDRLTGDAGADSFIYRAPGDGGDTILDFTSGSDRIEISGPGFGISSTSRPSYARLNPGFDPNTLAAFPVFLFDPTDGRLLFDPDGSGPAARISLAIVGAGTMFQYEDLVVTATPASNASIGDPALEAFFDFKDGAPTPEVSPAFGPDALAL